MNSLNRRVRLKNKTCFSSSTSVTSATVVSEMEDSVNGAWFLFLQLIAKREGNKKAMGLVEKMQEDKTIDPGF